MNAFTSIKKFRERPSVLRNEKVLLHCATLFALPLILGACTEKDPNAGLIAQGEHLFMNETFSGNGRTCGTCHRSEDNFRITPAFIATLPPEDPLFVAEYDPNLKENFEKPALMREFGLILMNPDGHEDLANKFVMRTVQSLRAVKLSVNGSEFEGYENEINSQGPHTGWAGDGAPGDGTLRSFALGAIKQHMTRSLARVEGADFRLPNDTELDALEAFMLNLGRQQEISLPLPLKSELALLGQELFLDENQQNARCSVCHINASASSMKASVIPEGKTINLGNTRHSTGEESMPGRPNSLIPFDDGFGFPGNRTFKTPSLVEAADAGPLFHNGAVSTVEAAVNLYNLDSFNDSETGAALTARFGKPTNLTATEVLAIGAFLRVINADENIRETLHHLEKSQKQGWWEWTLSTKHLRQASYETDDAIQVLSAVNLHPLVIGHLLKASALIDGATGILPWRDWETVAAMAELRKARKLLFSDPKDQTTDQAHLIANPENHR